MNTIKITLLAFKKNAFTFILVIAQLAVLFLAENYMVSALVERKMQFAPFEPLLNDNTAFVYDIEYEKNAAMLGMDSKASRETLLSGINDEYKIYDVMSFTNGEYTVYSVSDEIYASLALPLAFGNYESGVGSFGMSAGEKVISFSDGSDLRLKISGTLTASTYIPAMTSFSSQDMTADEFYYSSVNERNIILTNRSSIGGYERHFRLSSGFLIEFKSGVAQNLEALKGVALTVPATEIAESTYKALQNDLLKFIPLVGTVLIIVIIGIICVSIITFKENERRNAVLWICGYSRAGIIGVHTAGTALVTALSVIISLAAFGIMKLSGNEMLVGINLTIENLVATFMTCALLSAISAVVPALKCRKASPAEYIRRAL